MQDKAGTVILHDYVEQTDGGSRLCLTLGEALEADFCCGFIRSGHPFLAEPYPGLVRTLMPGLPLPLVRQLALALAFEQSTSFITRYETAVFSGAYAPLAANRRARQHNVYYCHTPPRFLYDQHEFFLGLTPWPLRPAFSAFCCWLRPRYEAAMKHMDVVVANSLSVQARVEKYLGMKAQVVYPPCDVDRYRSGQDHGYFLSLARLDPLKRVEMAIRAFLRLPDQRLLVTSDGPEAGRLRRLAAGAANIQFTDTVDESRRLDLLAHCRATLCLSRDEDFGMAAVESMAAGKPVIAIAEGGFAETVLNGETGIWLLSDAGPEDVVKAVTAMDERTAGRMSETCRERARLYATPRFLSGMLEACSPPGKG
jgi:glycosyltransferase involved in cell wall biosynthesis